MASVPTYIYKIVPSSTPPPSLLPEALPVSDLDKKDGFIHLSTALQVPGTLKRFFADADLVYIVRITYDQVKSNIKWEDTNGIAGGVGEEGMYPHLYNELRLGKDEIKDVVEWKKDPNGWDGVINKSKEESWFIY